MIAWLNQIVDVVEEDLAADLDVVRLAAALGTTEYHLRRMFSALAGMPLLLLIGAPRRTEAPVDTPVID